MIEHQFEAWPYGPVLPELYSVLSGYGDAPITKLINHTEDNTPYLYTEGTIFDAVVTSIQSFSNRTAWELSNISHSDNGPWFQTVRMHGYRKKIDNDLIKQYFEKNMELFL